MPAPPAVPALPDTERRVAYTLASSTGPMPVTFAVYGDGTDYQDWLEVWLNEVLIAYNDPLLGWTLTSPTGPLGSIPRPITDGTISFTNAQSGTVQIVGARRPRRLTQFTENTGVPARDMNQALTDIVADGREMWDRSRNRMAAAPAGETIGQLPSASARANLIYGFDGSGNPKMFPFSSGGGGGTIVVGNPIIGGAANQLLYDTGGSLGEATVGGGLTFAGGVLGGGMIVGGAVTGGAANRLLYDTGGTMAEAIVGTGLNLAGGTLTSIGGFGVFNVREYGAVGNGTTDDTAAINSAIAAFNAAGAGVLFFPAVPSTFASLTTTGATGTGTISTLSYVGPYTFPVGSIINVSGVTPTAYNGTWAVTASTSTSVSFINTTTAPQTVAGTIVAMPAYLITASLTTITARGIVYGQGNMNNGGFAGNAVTSANIAPAFWGSLIACSSTSAAVFTVVSGNLTFRDIAIQNTAALGTQTAASRGIQTSFPTLVGMVNYDHITVANFYINIDQNDCLSWTMDACLLLEPVQYDLQINNSVNTDGGDWAISNCLFGGAVTVAPAAAAINYIGSSGCKITNCKFNSGGTGLTDCIHMTLSTIANSDIEITNCSFEGFTGSVINGGVSTHFSVSNCQVWCQGSTGQQAVFNITSGEGLAFSNIEISSQRSCFAFFFGLNPTHFLSISNINLSGIAGAITQSQLLGLIDPSSPGILFSEQAQFRVAVDTANATTTLANAFTTQVMTTTAASGTGSQATLTYAATQALAPGSVIFVNGVAPATYNGIYTVQLSNTTSVSYGNGASGAQTVAGTVTVYAPQIWLGPASPTISTTRMYQFEAYLPFTCAAAGGIQVALTGSSGLVVLNIIYDGWIIDSASNGIKGMARGTSLGAVVASSTTTGTAGIVLLKGEVTVSQIGQLNLQFAQNTANATPTIIKAGAWFKWWRAPIQ
jgi:hypothetical protein